MVFSDELSYVSNNGKEYICKTCDTALMRGSLPKQAKSNGLELCTAPPELSDLNALRAETDLPSCAIYENDCITFW